MKSPVCLRICLRSFSSFGLLIAMILSFSACKRSRPDVSGIDIDLKVNRFEKDLFSLDTEHPRTSIDQVAAKYGDFFFFYFNEYARSWRMKKDTSQAWKDSVIAYISDDVLRKLYDSTEQQYADLTEEINELTTSIRYFKYYFPEMAVPEVITLINGPGHGAFTYGDSTLCIALDDYLGPKFSFYRYENIPDYLIRRFSREYITPNCLQVMITHLFPFDPSGKKLLDAMIYNGKVLYLRSLLMPGAPDSIVTGFAEADLKWCDQNEPEIWKFFIGKNLLYSQDPLEYLKYVNEGPTTSGMPPEAPGNTGTWVGWKIVAKYMKQHPDFSPEQLMHESDAQKILTESKYKP